ncbi:MULTISPECIES: efflux RND transporter periplasmic adaptor subunit [Gilvimarinus]|jgi:cobalt-zinc-cadmium efflux system membrane fusion protein|uniref:Efflux RND transporter periplasmic adaptor subunit n=2 Tax=Gilvimarinus TaxID=940550 RepID=A0A9X2KT72_9GAMM|nr:MULTISPECIES: efflux RND transporter periplasmic adaptor subunit [Gilvimarinus]MCP8898483.1 efflux RND transporter periplasmic adaptor subunit [Gilvimarinus xylanilyticus]MDO3382409.1 efflux RND transporter periplasmic adaptor subunit [Gilvimarinus sp. SDUM040014]
MKSLASFWIFMMSMALPLSGVSISVQAQEAEHSDHEHEQTQKEKTHNDEDSGEHDDHSEHEDHEEGHDDHQDHGENEGAHDEAGEEAHEEHDEHGGHEEQSTSIDPQTLRALGAEVSIASPGRVSQTVSLPGEVRLNKEAVAQITPRYPAQIVDVSARIGDSVAAGDTLAIGESSQTLQRFSLKSLIRGTVIDRSVTLGEHIQPSDAAFVVADLSTLWVDIALYPRQIGLVKKGQPVRISTTFGPEPVNTQIDYLDPMVSEQLRTGLARIYLDNAAGQWRPGMFIDAEVTLTETEAEVVVPQTAVIKYQGRQVVFVKEGDSWHPRPVVLGAKDRGQVVILSGVSSGEQYVAKGGFTLKADLLKSEFESGHNH